MLKSKWYIVEIITIVALLLAIWLISFLKSFSSVDASIFNALTALFSLFAFIAVVLTLILQYHQLQSQQEQFLQQNFETAFFSMLTTQRQIIDQIECQTLKGVIKGRSCFIHIENAFRMLYDPQTPYRSDDMDIGYLVNSDHVFVYIEKGVSKQLLFVNKSKGEHITEAANYLKLIMIKSKVDDYEWTMLVKKIIDYKFLPIHEHYFNHLYQILRYIKENEDGEKINAHQKYQKYVDILRSQLSNSELFLLFYDSLTHKRLLELIEYYGFLHYLDPILLLNTLHLNYRK